MAFDYCNGSLIDHELIPCGNYKKSGFPAYAVLEQDHGITDFTSSSEWNNAIASGKVKIVKQIKGELVEPTAIEGENPVGGQIETITDGISWEFSVMDSNATVNNDGFYEDLNKRTVYIVPFSNRANEIYVVEQDCRCFARPVIPGAGGQAYQYYQVNFTWESDSDEFFDRYTAPAGMFTV